MNNKTLLFLSSALLFLSLSGTEVLLKNPQLKSSEPGVYPSWTRVRGDARIVDGATQFQSDAKSGKFLFFQKFTPAPEVEYLLSCEVSSTSGKTPLRIYAEETRMVEKKLHYTTFRGPRTTAPAQWLKITSRVRLEPGWKDFYVAISGSGKDARIRNLKFEKAPRTIEGNLLKNADMAAGDKFAVAGWQHISGTAESDDGVISITPVKGKALLFQKLAVPAANYLLTYEISYSGSGKARIYAEKISKGADKKVSYQTFAAPRIKADGQWKKISIPVRLTGSWKDFYVAAAVNGNGVMKIRSLSFLPVKK